MRRIIVSASALCLLLACSNPNQRIEDMSLEGGGPDTTGFSLLRPLATPPQLTLPQPTPGGTNLADP